MGVYHNSFFAMGSRFNAVLPFYNHEICEQLFNLIQNEVLRIESKLSYFYPESEVYKINKTACKSFVKIDDELFNILETCLEYSGQTFGAFDITLRPIIESIEKNGGAATKDGRSFLNQIKLNNTDKSVYFESDKVKIDFGGFGKGYALEKIKSFLDDSPIENAFISFGESSIMTKGKHPKGDNWQVGIKNFFDAQDSIHTFNLSDSSISSSGNYYVDDSGQLHNKVNVINPVTGSPVEGLSVVSVKSGSPLEAEILSTAFLVMQDEQINTVLDGFKDIEVVKVNYIDNKPVKIFFNKA
jgi:FAD:protein FMN transferase